MKLINALQSRPTIFFILMIIIICICIIGIVVVLLCRLENEKRVTKAALELKRITNSIRAGLVNFHLEDGRILYSSHGFYEMLGYTKSAAKLENKFSLMDFIDPRDINFLDEIKKQLENDIVRIEVHMVSKDGCVLTMMMTGNGSEAKNSRHTISVVFVDVTEQKQMQELILLEGERYRIATEISKDVIFEYNIENDEMLLTDKFQEIFGIHPLMTAFIETRESRRYTIHPNDWGIYLEFNDELRQGNSIIEKEFRIRNQVGDYIWCQLMGKTIYGDDKKPIRVIGKLVNIDAQKRELEALEYKATRDPLTGIYNKEITINKIDQFISNKEDNVHMLMLIDFDDFKNINDTYGHLQGDKVLIYIIGRIKEIFTEGEIIGRIGGDEFVVFLGNVKDIDLALHKAQLLKEALDTTYISGDKSIPISGSIGISVYPEAGIDYEQLMESADQALYQVKEQGKKNFMLYKPAT